MGSCIVLEKQVKIFLLPNAYRMDLNKWFGLLRWCYIIVLKSFLILFSCCFNCMGSFIVPEKQMKIFLFPNASLIGLNKRSGLLQRCSNVVYWSFFQFFAWYFSCVEPCILPEKEMRVFFLLRGGNSETGFSPIPMLTYGENLPHDNSLCNLIN